MGLPNINIEFIAKGATAIVRSGRGVVACIMADATEGGDPFVTYTSVADVDFTKYTENNYEYLQMIFAGAPSKVHVVRVAAETPDYAAALKVLQYLKFNYLTVPDIDNEGVTVVTSWIKEQRDQQKKTFKVVLPTVKADHEGIINFTTGGIVTNFSKRKLTAAQYCPRIAGVFAGLTLDRSATYYNLTDISAADTPDDPDARIDAGELIVVYDGDSYKLGRAVNSLTTFTGDKRSDMSKIKIVEGMDLYKDDIKQTFEDFYVGNYINDYDNKQMFVAAINSYTKQLEGNVLDRSYDNAVAVDVEAQRTYLESGGTDTTSMADIDVAKANTGSHVFINSNVKFVDAMEDMDMRVNM